MYRVKAKNGKYFYFTNKGRRISKEKYLKYKYIEKLKREKREREKQRRQKISKALKKYWKLAKLKDRKTLKLYKEITGLKLKDIRFKDYKNYLKRLEEMEKPEIIGGHEIIFEEEEPEIIGGHEIIFEEEMFLGSFVPIELYNFHSEMIPNLNIEIKEIICEGFGERKTYNYDKDGIYCQDILRDFEDLVRIDPRYSEKPHYWRIEGTITANYKDSILYLLID